MHASAEPLYRLAPHVYLCVASRNIVLLDLKRDRYLGFSAAESSGLSTHVEGWPKVSSDASEITNVDCTKLLDEMVDSAILTTDASGKLAVPIEYSAPESTLIDGYSEIPTAISNGDVLRFLISVGVVWTHLHLRPLEIVLARVRARRIMGEHRRPNAVPLLPRAEAAQSCVAVFRRLRPLIFTARNACLFDSLVLLEFLSRYDLFPDLVFGVTTAPFGAHCWVQKGPVVFDDTPENVRRYTPIMIV